jgi:hypothetical protein
MWTSQLVGAVLLSLVLAQPASSTPLAGYERHEFESGPFYCVDEGGPRVEWAREFIPRVLARVEKKLGRRRGRPFTTVIVGTTPELQRIVKAYTGRKLSAHVLGVALPSRDLLVVRSDIVSVHLRDSTPVTLVHEIAHLVIHRDPSASIPRWFDEGLSMWVSEGSVAARDEADLSMLARIGGLFPLSELEVAISAHHQAQTLGYRQSLHVVNYLLDTGGEKSIHSLLDELEGGATFPEALERVVGDDIPTFETDFREWAKGRASLLTVVLAFVNVWILIGPLAVIACLRQWRKRRRQMRQLEADEEDDAADDDALAAVGPESARPRPSDANEPENG